METKKTPTMDEIAETLPVLLKSLKAGTRLGNVVFVNDDTDTVLGVGVAGKGSEDIVEKEEEVSASSDSESEEEEEIVVEEGYEPPAKKARVTENTIQNLARTLRRVAARKDAHFDTFDDIKSLKVRVGDRVLPLASCTLAQLKPLAEPAPFGNLAENCTTHDEGVRRALQCRSFSVVSFVPRTTRKVQPSFDRVVLDALSAREDTVFHGATNLRLIPHAINIYRVGDHFARHVDTQRHADMLGTVTFVAGKFEGGDLLVCHPADDSQTLEVEAPGEGEMVGVVLRATCPHQVEKVTGGLRVSATFDVCGTMTFSDRDSTEVLRAVDAVFDSHADCRHIGLVLDHMYTAQDRARGVFRSSFDQTLVRVVGARGTLVPLQWTQNRKQPCPYDRDNDRWKPKVTRNYVSTLSEADAATYASALFFSGRGENAGFTAARDIQIAADHTGNESIEGHDNAIYLVTVLMIARRNKSSE